MTAQSSTAAQAKNSKPDQMEAIMNLLSATQRNRKRADAFPTPSTRKSEYITGSAGRFGAARKTPREDAARPFQTGHRHGTPKPHVSPGVVMRAAVIGITIALHALSASAQSARDVKGPTPLVAIPDEAPAKLIVDPPIPEQLALGRVFIQYRTENLRILPVFGSAALAVSPRIGHLHYKVDDQSWPTVDTSGETVVLVGLAPGPHKVLLELADAAHKPIAGASKLVEFVVPAPKGSHN
jgi:hypothetical protein